jgi:hypothetical protein
MQTASLRTLAKRYRLNDNQEQPIMRHHPILSFFLPLVLKVTEGALGHWTPER